MIRTAVRALTLNVYHGELISTPAYLYCLLVQQVLIFTILLVYSWR